MFLFKNKINSQNLINNSSFEAYSNMDCVYLDAFQNNSTFPALHVVDNWQAINSPDYFSTICTFTYTYRGIPINTFGTSYAKHGNAYVGIYIYIKSGESKEYFYQTLSTPLIADSIYCLSFFTSRADRMPYAIKNLGAYFSNNLPTIPLGYVSATPQIVNTSGFLTDTIGWTELQGCFTAQGGEQYVTIGNFNSNSNTDTLRIQSTNTLTGPGTDLAYYYIDSVSLWKNSFPVGIKEQGKNEVMSVYPNPVTDVITFKFADAIEKRRIEIKITDVLGREILLSEFKEQLDISQLETGIYFVSIIQENKILVTKKVVKQ
jgi:hypothetical protein